MACGQSETNNSTQNKPPNIVLVFTDDQGYNDVGVYGSEGFETPNLDQLAQEGVRLTSYYAAQAVCSASRAGLLTGCYPNRIGIHNALMPKSNIGLSLEEETLAEILKAKGYQTGIFGKWHLGDHHDFMPLNHGFDTFFGIPYSNDMWPNHPQQGSVFNFDPLPLYEDEKVIDTLTEQSQLTKQITERSIAFIEQHKDQPFFLYIPHPQPHVPLFVSENFKGKSKRGLYGDVIMEIDWSMGQIIKTLRKNDLEENTIVIFTSDNGPWLAYGDHAGSAFPFKEGKGTAWEGGHREPFIIKYPKQLSKGKVIDNPLMAIDILPTLIEAVGAKMPLKKIDGKSGWSLLKGNSDESPQEAYFFYYKTNELHAVRQGDYKLYFPHTYRSMDGQESGSGGIPGQYKQIEMRAPELYNLMIDPREQNDIAAEQPELVQKLERLGDSIRNELGDALTNRKGIGVREPGIVEKPY